VPRPKLLHIETMRGIACLLLVAYHVIGAGPSVGMRLSSDDMLPILSRVFSDIRMPMFAFISGFVFTGYTGAFGAVSSAMAKKSRRLLIPLVAVSTVHYLVQAAAVEQSELPLWQIYFLPYAHFWYLQATFLIMATLTLTAFALGGRRALSSIILLLLSAAIFILVPRWEPDVFSGWKAIYLAPFFLAGHLAAAHFAPDDRLRRWIIAALSLVLALQMGVEVTLSTGAVWFDPPWRASMTLATGLTCCFLLLALRPSIPALSYIGEKSYAIFLFHVFFTAGSRIMLAEAWPSAPNGVIFAVGLAAGIAGPIALTPLLMRHRVTALLGLGIDLGKGRSGVRRAQTASAPPG
jgi:peptidoglycan/LPS O-acetylase OafA/YrhL